MGLFNRKPDNRVKCPECDGSGYSGSHQEKNTESRPRPFTSPTQTSHRYEMAGNDGQDSSAFWRYQENITVFDKCSTCDGKKKVSPETAAAHQRYNNEKTQLRRDAPASRERAINLFNELSRLFPDLRPLSGPLFNTMSAVQRIEGKGQSEEIATLNQASQKFFSKIEPYETNLTSSHDRSRLWAEELGLFRELRNIIQKMIKDKAAAVGLECDSNYCLKDLTQEKPISEPRPSPFKLQINTSIEKCNIAIKSLSEKGVDVGGESWGLKYVLEKSLEALSAIGDKTQKDLIFSANYFSSIFFSQFDTKIKRSNFECQPLLESIYHNFNEVMRLKSQELGMRYTFRDSQGLKIYYLENWS